VHVIKCTEIASRSIPLQEADVADLGSNVEMRLKLGSDYNARATVKTIAIFRTKVYASRTIQTVKNLLDVGLYSSLVR
jgi:hypothetical protein